ncbi:MAG: hypothetical protein WKG07_37270 [Hymenobacter sp.]
MAGRGPARRLRPLPPPRRGRRASPGVRDATGRAPRDFTAFARDYAAAFQGLTSGRPLGLRGSWRAGW